MRKFAKVFLSLYLCGLPALAQTEGRGEYLTVTVSGAPESVAQATVDLGPGLQGLELSEQASGEWVGSFAILPGMVKETLQPQVDLLDAKHRSVARRPGDGVDVALTRSDFDQEGLARVMSDKNTVFVFDHNVAVETIKLWTARGGEPVVPEFRDNSFAIPWGVAPINIASITADSAAGQALVFSPTWDVDVAEVEEEF